MIMIYLNCGCFESIVVRVAAFVADGDIVLWLRVRYFILPLAAGVE